MIENVFLLSRKKITFLDKRRCAKEQILSGTSLLYVPLSGPQHQIAFTVPCIRFPLSACLHTLITKKRHKHLSEPSRWEPLQDGASVSEGPFNRRGGVD